MLDEVPSGWRQVRVGDLGGTYNGLSGKSKDDFGSGSPFVTYRQVFSGRPIDLAECDRVQVGPTENQASVRKGDVLFTTSSETVEEVAFSTLVHADIPGLYLNSFCFGFRPNDGAPLDPHFAQYFFRGPDFRTAAIRLGQGSTRYNISKTRLMEVLLRLPPLPEQKKIAAILSSVDEAIQATQAVIDQTRRVKEGLLQDLLTRGIGHTRFKQTEIGEIPEGWEVRPLKDVCTSRNAIVDGPFGSNLKTEHYRASGVPVIQTRMVTSGRFVPGEYVYVDPLYFDEIKRSAVHGGDIVMAKIGIMTGRSCILPPHHPESVLAGNCVKITPDRDVMDVRFVHEYLERFCALGLMRGVRQETVQRSLSVGNLRRLAIPVPPLPEQVEIAESLAATDTAMMSSAARLVGLHASKSGLLTDLLTGKVRVTP
jgi:type I restriction enzyme S subunit